MRVTVTFIVFASVFFISTIPVYAQEDSRTGRRAQFEIRKNAERQREMQRQNGFRAVEDVLEPTIDEQSHAYRAGVFELRLESLLKLTQEFALQIEEIYFASLSEDWSQPELDRRSKGIEQSTDQLRDMVNFGTDPPQINVAPLPEESFERRVQRLVNVSRRLVPNIILLAGGESINLDLRNQVRDDLALTEALSLALRQSAF